MNYKLTVVPLALSAVLYLNGCGGQSNYTPQKVVEKPKMKYKLNVSAMDGAIIKVGDMPYTPNMELLEGTHTITILKDGYDEQEVSLNLIADRNISIELQKSLQFEGGIHWENNDFLDGYLKIRYANGLFYAFPKTKPSDKNEIRITSIFGGAQAIALGKGCCPKDNNTIFAPYVNLDSIQIGGLKEWKIPTYEQLNNEYVKNLIRSWKLGWAQSAYFRTFDYLKNQYSGFGLWINSSGEHWLQDSGEADHLVLVRTAMEFQETILENHKLDVIQKVKKYALLATKEKIKPVMQTVSEPIKIEMPTMPILKKDEFETTADFEKRKAQSFTDWEKEKKEVEKKNIAIEKKYQSELKNSEKDYEEQVKLSLDENYKSRIYKEYIKEAVQLFLGKPAIKDLSYDADKQKMSGIIYSLDNSSFSRTVQFNVSLANAKTTKSELESGALVPFVTLDSNLQIANFKLATNDSKIGLEFDIAKSENTIKAYENFIAKYPNSSLIKDAKNGIAKLQEADRTAQLKRQKEDAESAKRSAEEERRFYIIGKCEVGSDVVDRERWNTSTGRGNIFVDAMFGGIKEEFVIEYYGTVESVAGSKVKVHINDWKVKQTVGGGFLSPQTYQKYNLQEKAEKKMGKAIYIDKSRCEK